MNTLTRSQAIEIAGQEAVEELEGFKCEPTGNMSHQFEMDNVVEFRSSIECEDKDGNEIVLSAYYYPDADYVDNEYRYDCIDWKIEHYEIMEI